MVFFNSNDKLKFKMNIKYLISKEIKESFSFNKQKKKIIVCLAADYGNLGDVAITYAQTEYLKKNFPNYDIIDFPISNTISNLKSLKSIVNNDDIITIVGGGNMGDVYYGIEICRQFIIKKFPNNKIISFPQTIEYSNSPEGKKRLKQAVRVYSKHKNLTLIARENHSFDFFIRNFKTNKSVLTPDIVFSLNESEPISNREGILLCLRNDKEKQLNDIIEQQMFDFLSNTSNVTIYDTQIMTIEMDVHTRKQELEKIWTKFRESKLVITDRLHGMIFCYITKTPCIAINNSNKKVSRVYNTWLKNNNYITLIENLEIEKFKEIVNQKMNENFNSTEIKNKDFNLEFKKILD